jgi:hypothetical protein
LKPMCVEKNFSGQVSINLWLLYLYIHHAILLFLIQFI